MISREKILSQVDELPSLPASIARLSALAGDEESCMRDFEEALLPDPALTANILRLANSAYFGCRTHVTSVRQALMRLGTKKVVETAVGAAFSSVIPDVLPGYGIDAAAFWRHSIAVAVLAERLGAELGLEAAGEVFTCGLLHDIGKLVTSTYLAAQAAELAASLEDETRPLLTAEREVLGVDHTEIGAAVAEKWNLSPQVSAVARWHHSPGEAEDGHRDVVGAAHVADCLAHAFGYGTDVGELSREVDAATLKRMEIPVEKLEEIVCESAAEIEDLAAVYSEKEAPA